MSDPSSGAVQRGNDAPVPVINDPFLQPVAAPPRGRTPWLLIVAVTSTALFLASSAAFVWLWQRGPIDAPTLAVEPPSDDPPRPPSAAVPAPSAPALPGPAPSGALSALPSGEPHQTRVIEHGVITVVDLGVGSQRTLQQELALQRASAQSAGQTLLLMTVHFGHPDQRALDATLADPLMQSALTGVRLVRVDGGRFEIELEELGIPTKEFPWFFLLGGDLVPRDGVSGGEWDENIPRNMAPVLGAFVKGTYKTRRERWTPPRGKGVQL